MMRYKPGDRLHTPAELTAALEAGCTVRDTHGDVAAPAGEGCLAYVRKYRVLDLADYLYPFEVVSVKCGG